MRRILVIGSRGQLGSDLIRVLSKRKDIHVSGVNREEIDITVDDGLYALLKERAPDVVINTAAHHNVDACERQEALQTFSVNALGARNLATACQELGSTLVHISTDYVFSGREGRPYSEKDIPAPVNVYGNSKLAGEHFVRSILDRHFIIRVAALFGIAGCRAKGGTNFIENMIRAASEGRPLRVVSDQITSCTYCFELAEKIGALMDIDAYGTLHMTNEGNCSWYDFAREIFKHVGLRPQIFEPIPSSEIRTVAERPQYSALNTAKLRGMQIGAMSHWRDALRAYLQEKGHIT